MLLHTVEFRFPEAIDHQVEEDDPVQFADPFVHSLHQSALNNFLGAGHSASNPLVNAGGRVQGLG